MKILSLSRNEANQIIAEVLNCGKTIRVFARSLDELVNAIYKACHFCDRQDVRDDLLMNYADFV
jgi:hypothetical protein